MSVGAGVVAQDLEVWTLDMILQFPLMMDLTIDIGGARRHVNMQEWHEEEI